ncbi:MAG: hypothetical protein U0871_25055 [Gemmataceae bacterium]
MFIAKLRPALAAAVLGGTVVAAGGLIVAAGQPPAPPGGPPGRAAAPGDLTAVTPADLARTYVTNAAAGDERYLGKRIRLRGSVWRVRGVPGGPGQPPSYLLVMTCGSLGAEGAAAPPPGWHALDLVFAYRFDAKSRKVLAALEVGGAGQQVTVEGVCAGQASEPDALVLFTDCKIIESPKP